MQQYLQEVWSGMDEAEGDKWRVKTVICRSSLPLKVVFQLAVQASCSLIWYFH